MPSRPGIENFNQIAEKFKKLENTIIASFQVKIGRERSRKRENKRNRSDGFFTRPGIENSKKIAKKFKNLENTIITSFQAKISWERPRNGKNKRNHSDMFLPDP